MNDIAERTFLPEDQQVFADLSGDYNPMHMDPVAARRTQAGHPVVHGVHAVLWALDAVGDTLEGVKALTVRFDKMIYVGDRCVLRYSRRADDGSSLDILVDDAVVARIVLAHKLEGTREPGEKERNSFAVKSSAASYEAAFPRAAATLGGDFLVELGGLSKLVGMVEPGLHSIFSSFAVIREGEDVPLGMRFEVVNEDDRFNRLTMRVTGRTLRGQVEAYRRAEPVEQPRCKDLRNHVVPFEFAGRTALVIGGSRGLGEITAKLLALGGAEVVITYAVGRFEAERVVRDIRKAGGNCEAVQLDIRYPLSEQIGAKAFNQLYHFATPFIAGKRGKGFDLAKLDQMMAFYVEGFYRACAHLRSTGSQAIDAFYPSSVFVESRPAGFTEYAMAKAAGEALCADIPRMLKGVRAHVRRLPRLPTDQTSSVQPLEMGAPVDEMLAAIRSMA